MSKQTCRFWKSFEIPKDSVVTQARLHIAVDNGYRLFLDGREIGRGSDWGRITFYDLTWVLEPGTHVLAIEAFNDGSVAGIILGMNAELVNGDVVKVRSDESWRVVPESERGWEKRTRPQKDWGNATIIAGLGSPPWWKVPTTLGSTPPLQPILVRFWQTGWFQITLLSLCGIVVFICLRLMTELALQSKAQRLIQVERARIARDIHDDVGAGLTQLVLLGEVAQSELPANSETRAQIDGICERARNLLGAMDEIVWVVNSRRDTLRDFVTYVCKYAQSFLQTTPIRCRLDVEPDLPPMDFDLPIRRNLLLAVKEALNNAAKHSGATELFVRIHREEQGIVVTVQDNGKGFVAVDAPQERNGMTNMQDRMNEVGGVCRVKTEPGKGCRVEFHLPFLHVQRRMRWWKWRATQKSEPATRNSPTAETRTARSSVISS